jgi:hypothetical protein
MIGTIKQLYHHLGCKPQIGMLSALSSYLLAAKGLLLTDETLKLVAALSSCAGCFVGCATALSWIIRAAIWLIKFYQKVKLHHHDSNSKMAD